jgi:23S rRNA (cytidine1920-2'-O)/16S rRNA (cytidine1409-2'-O)-methyltransferase
VVAKRFPARDTLAEIRAGHVWVNGFPVTNPDALVATDASIALRAPQPLAGEAKLRAALAAFAPRVEGRICVDVGASTGGFTRVLLEAGARRVYAVDAGFGQLLGSLRQDPRVVNLERTNLGALDTATIPDVIELVTIDVAYVALARAVPQLGLRFASTAELIALVKPMYELGLAAPPSDAELPEALRRAADGIASAGWEIAGVIPSPVLGGRGAKELLLHARRPPGAAV